MELDDLRESLKKMEVLSSNRYISFMVQVCSKLNSSPPSQVSKVDISDLQSGKSNLIFIQLKNIQKPLAVDLQYVSRLRVELQDMFLAQLNRHISMFPPEIKEIIKNLTKKFNSLQKNMSVKNLQTFVNPEIYLKPIKDILQKAEEIGGNAKVDFYFDALTISAEKRFDCAYLYSVLANKLDPYREHIIASLKNISEVKNPDKYVELLKQNIEVLQAQTDSIYKMLRDEYDIKINLDESVSSIKTDWFKLDVPTESTEQLFQFIYNFKDDASLIEKSYFEEKKDEINEKNLRNQFRLIQTEDIKKQFEDTIALFEKTKNAMILSTDKNGSLLSVIEQKRKWDEIDESDYLSITEWLDTNGKKCQNLLLDIYNKLVSLKSSNNEFELPPGIQEMYENTLKTREKEISELKAEIEQVVKKADKDKIEKQLEELKNVTNKDKTLLEKLSKAITSWEELAEELSPSNIFLIEKIELAHAEKEASEIIVSLWDFSQFVTDALFDLKELFCTVCDSLSIKEIPDNHYSAYIAYKKEQIMREIRELDFKSVDATQIEKQINETKDIDFLCKIKDVIVVLPKTKIIFEEVDKRIDRGELTEEEGKTKKQFIEDNYKKLEELKKEIERKIRDEIVKDPSSVGKDTRMSVYGLDTIIPERLVFAAKRFNRKVKEASTLEEVQQLQKEIKEFEETVIKSQKMAEVGGEYYKKIESQLENGLISEQLANSLKQDISTFYSGVKEILKQISKNQAEMATYLRKMENRMTGIAHFDDESHNEMTIDITDIEELDRIYSFTSDVSVERKKKFCKMWDLRRKNILEYMKKHQGETVYNVFVSDEMVKDYDEKNIISTATKAALYHQSNEIFDDECSFVLVGAELIDPRKFHHKKLFQNLIHFFVFILKDKNYGRKEFNKFFARIQTLIKQYIPEQNPDIFKQNSSRLLSELLKLF